MLLDTDRIRVRHMIDAAEQALAYTSNASRADLDSNPPLQALLVRNLEILGEAAARTTQPLRDTHPEVPWRTIISMRNRLVHVYYEVDMDIIWETVQNALPGLVVVLRRILESSLNRRDNCQ